MQRLKDSWPSVVVITVLIALEQRNLISAALAGVPTMSDAASTVATAQPVRELCSHFH